MKGDRRINRPKQLLWVSKGILKFPGSCQQVQNGCCHKHVPTSSGFISITKLSLKMQTLCYALLASSTHHTLNSCHFPDLVLPSTVFPQYSWIMHPMNHKGVLSWYSEHFSSLPLLFSTLLHFVITAVICIGISTH